MCLKVKQDASFVLQKLQIYHIFSLSWPLCL